MTHVRNEMARCLRLLLEGKVTWDHIIEEFKNHDVTEIADSVEIIKKAAAEVNKYEKPKQFDAGLRTQIEKVIQELDPDGAGGRKG